MNVRAGVLVALLAAGGLAACGESGGESTGAASPSTTFRDEGTPTTAPRAAGPSTTLSAVFERRGLLICFKDKWSLINPMSGAAKTILDAAGDCTSSPPIPMGAGTTKYSTIFRLSADTSKYSAIQSRSDGAKVAGYIPINGGDLGTFKDLSGYQPSFSGQLVKDGNALFNPTTGDLWWQRDTKLFSAPVTGGPPQDRGEGKLLLFTQQGEPMPSAVRESPSGRTRLVNRVVGTAGEISSACQQRASRDAVGTAERCAGVSSFPGASGRINADPDCLAEVVGLIDDEALVCLASNMLTAARIVRSGATASLANERPLIPKTEQVLLQAALSPDGITAFFLARAGGVVTLYRVPTSGTASEPVALTKWSEAPSILGWVEENRRFPAW